MPTPHDSIVIVCPIPKTPERSFLDAVPEYVPMIVIDDSDGRLDLPDGAFDVYDYQRQAEVLGPEYEEFLQYHHSAACRNLGHYIAYKRGYRYVISLDYDCNVPAGFIEEHLQALRAREVIAEESATGWVNPIHHVGTGSDRWYTRGYPYELRNSDTLKTTKLEGCRVGLHMGLWENVIDINGIDKVLKRPPARLEPARPYTAVIGMMPVSGMNNMFLGELIPAYLFLPNFRYNGYWTISRHDDIWGGYILKRLMDRRGDLMTYGEPVVFHSRETDQQRVMYHEHYMHLMNSSFYHLVDRAMESIEGSDYRDMFARFALGFDRLIDTCTEPWIPRPYLQSFKSLSRACLWWARLFERL